MSNVLERYLGELPALRSKIAEESLTNVAGGAESAFEYGRAVGRLEGLRLAEESLNKLLNEPEQDSDSGRRGRKA